jgi:hypothetical protein
VSGGVRPAQEAVDLYRELVALNRDAYLPNLATSVTNFAVYLAEGGRRAEGLAAAREAVELYREAVAVHGDVFAENLQSCLRRCDLLLEQLDQPS